MILAVSHAQDDHAAAVLGELGRMGHPARLVDTADYPVRAAVTMAFATPRPTTLAFGGSVVDAADVGAVWWRRPQPYTVDPGLSPEAARFSFTEAHEAISGLWHSLDATWVNPPDLDEVAHHKPVQLARAVEVGLAVPATLITNDPGEARAFIERAPAARTIYKTFVATAESWRETRVLRAEELALLDSVRLAPVIFQDYVDAVADLRVTVVGEEVWPAEIRVAPGGYQADYRMDLAGASFRPTALPDALVDRLRALLARLGLVYGAVDLRLTPEGDYVFLEVNPAGEWRFVEERTGQPITRSMAALLARLDKEKRR